MTPRERQIVDALSAVLARDDLPALATARFDELGLDSLAGLRLAARLEAGMKVPIDVEWLYDHPSARQLAAFLNAHLDLPTP